MSSQDTFKHVPTMLTIKQTSSRTGISEYSLRKLVKSGKIIVLQVGNKQLINFERFIDYLNSSSVDVVDDNCSSGGIVPIAANLR